MLAILTDAEPESSRFGLQRDDTRRCMQIGTGGGRIRKDFEALPGFAQGKPQGTGELPEVGQLFVVMRQGWRKAPPLRE